MAPFRAFIEERMYQKSMGVEIGPMLLYFGSRHRTEEYLYGEELEAYLEAGVVTHLGLAFSRDQKEKIYIQNRMREDSVLLGDLMLKDEGVFYLCGPTWPVPDVRDAWVEAFRQKGMEVSKGLQLIEDLKTNDRFILEVY
jgi:sulfite reductase (NADPH) flavoprotein alpha-component